MKLSKRIITLTILIAMLFAIPFLGTSNVAIASPAPDKEFRIVEKYNEISDLDVLYEHAKKGITDYPNLDVGKWQLKDKDGKIIEGKPIVTTQKLSVAKNALGETQTTYKTTAFVTLAYDGSRYDSNYDGSYSVKAYSTIYWNNSSQNGYNLAVLVRTTGGWQIYDSSVSLSNRQVTMANQGHDAYDRTVNESITRYPTSNSYTYDLIGWTPVQINDVPFFFLGSTSYVKLTRAGSSWDFWFTNNYK